MDEAFHVSVRIHSHVGRQSIAYLARKIIDERDVAESITAAPVYAVCFKRVAAIGNEEEQAPTGRVCFRMGSAQGAHDFLQRGAIVNHVFKHFMRENEVVAVFWEGQLLSGSADQVQATLQGLHSPLNIIFDSDCGFGGLRKSL